MAAPAALAPAQRVGITAGVLLALGNAASAIGPIALGGLRDTFGSYEVGWLLVLGLALILIGSAFGIPGRSLDRPTPDQALSGPAPGFTLDR
jgi:cyanate permease